MKLKKIIATLLCAIMALSALSCGDIDLESLFGGGSSTVGGCTTAEKPAESTPSETVDNTPLPERSAEEIYELVKKYFAAEVDVNYEMTVTDVTVNDDGSTNTFVTQTALMLAGKGADMRLYYKMNSDGEEIEYTYVGDGYAYGVQRDENAEMKAKREMTADGMREALTEWDVLYTDLPETQELADAGCEINDGYYLLTVKGITDGAFVRLVLGYDEDDRMLGIIKNLFIYDPTEDYTATFTVDRGGRVVSCRIETKHVFSCDDPSYGMPGRYECSRSVELISSAAVPKIERPADADEYKTVSPD